MNGNYQLGYQKIRLDELYLAEFTDLYLHSNCQRDFSKVSFEDTIPEPSWSCLSQRTFLVIILLINERKLSVRIPKDSS